MGRPKRIVILGGGTGGTLVANRLHHTFSATEMTITVVDQDDRHGPSSWSTVRHWTLI